MIRLVYMSHATKPFSSNDLLSLLNNARKNNQSKRITGVLLYHNECFVQVLEGEEDIVNNVFQTIKKDPRHKDIVELERQFIKQRQFPDWSMGFEELSAKELAELSGGEIEQDLVASLKSGPHEFKQKLITSLMTHFHNHYKKRQTHDELPIDGEHQTLICFHKLIRLAVTVLAGLMVLVIFLGVVDVVYVLFEELKKPPYLMLSISEMLGAFGAFLAVLIAIEIFINISLYLRSDVIPVKLVVATALMAISRKVIVFDFKNLDSSYIYASATVVLALGITYWLLDKKEHGKTD